ncbi:histone deacetylase [Emydomyces testavorans]|uniref:Histone deacetylase n=1 Tax=Emydomyces testavorans TaxID=2070801 RepID=A0AAF0DJH7_9EURO|nr:histone deacetylase [Emydomyces testavorans]
MSSREHTGLSGRHQPPTTNNGHEQLVNSFNQLSLDSQAALSHSSPVRSNSQSFRTVGKALPSLQDPFAHSSSTLRKTPSSSSMRDDRRASTPLLQKRLSTTSLRSVSSPRPGGSRRSSMQFSSSMPPRSPSAVTECPSPPPPPTASSIAADYFMKELAHHQSTNLQSKTVVVVQDSCYGHRYSRPRTSRASLEAIVERPERLHAGILGLASAYVRMGQRWGRNRYAPHPGLDMNSLPVPPFQIRKSTRTIPLNSPAVTHVHGAKWMGELQMMCEAAESRLALNGKELVRPNSSGSNGSTSAPKLHEGDLYLCPESLNAFGGALGGVCDGVDAVFGPDATRRAFVCIRPPGHHCSSDYPSGFCWLNNVHVGIAHAAMVHGLTHAAIIDFDLHHGDGSQAIAWEQNQRAMSASKNAPSYKKTKIGYFSLHDINSYPCEDGDEAKVMNASICIDNAHGQSVWNVHLEPWKDALEFWQLYNTKYKVLLDKARGFLRSHSQQLRNTSVSTKPQAAIFVSAGFDASEWEGAGMQRHKVNVPTDFYAKFTSDIIRLAEEEDLAVDGRIISVLEGGYSDRALTSGVLSHLSALADTRNAIVENTDRQSGLASEMLNRLSLTDENGHGTNCESTVEAAVFDTMWWSVSMLEELEMAAQQLPPPLVRKSREKGQPSFLAHTQASAAKAITPMRERSPFSSHQAAMDEHFSVPEVDWALAAVELSKVIIPTDRQTFSFKHAELKGESNRIKRERHSLTGPTDLEIVAERGHMQLRQRKPRAAALQENQPWGSRSTSRSTRRTTITSVSDLPDPALSETPVETVEEVNVVVAQHSRKPSDASSVISTVSAVPRSSSARKVRDATGRPASRAQGPTTRPETSTSSSVQKRGATSSARPVGTNGRSNPKRTLPPTANIDIPTGTQAATHGPSHHGDVDKMSNGVRKLNLKLKVPTPEEHAAREAARIAEARKKSPTKLQKKSSTAGTTKPLTGKSASRTSRTVISPAAPQVNTKTEITDPAMVPLPAESNPVSPVDTSTANDQKTPGNLDNHQLTDHRSFPSPPLTPLSPPSHQQASVKSAPATAHTRENLPVFTSTSAIPFGSSLDGRLHS